VGTAGRKVAEQPAVKLTWMQVMAWRLPRHHLHQRVPQAAMLKVNFILLDVCASMR
jgi:hypothetical protein